MSFSSFFSAALKRTSRNSSAPTRTDNYRGEIRVARVEQSTYDIRHLGSRLQAQQALHSLELDIVAGHSITKLSASNSVPSPGHKLRF